MKYTPHEYQAYCIQRVVEDPAVGLFLRPGLGKTVITLTSVNILKYFRWQVSRVLVVAPKKVAEATWQKEAARWDHLGKLRISTVLGSASKRIKALSTPADIYVINRENVEWLVDYYKQRPQYELSEEDFDFMVGVNQKGTFTVTQAVTRVMFEKKDGVIINMSSCAGLMGSRGHSCYSATKAAIHGFTMSWAKELGPFGIRVVGVAPDILDRTPANNDEKYRAQAYGRGWDVDTKPEKFFENYKSSIPLGRPGHLYEVADLICYLVSSHASYITGVTIPVSGGKSKG